MLLDNLTLFLRIAEKGGLAAGGRELGLSPATVSERLAALETYYGARLVNRTTRRLSLTEEGRALAEGAQRLLAEAQELETQIRLGASRMAGPIRLSAPSDLGRNRIVPVIDRYLARHPEVSIDLHLGDGYADLTAMGFDLAVRYGDLVDSTLITRPIGQAARIVCAAPDYLARCGTPAKPDDLASHNCILMRFGAQIDQSWPFRQSGKIIRLTVRGDRIANDGDLVRQWALAGHGIVRKSYWDVVEDLRLGRLVPLLRSFEVPPLRVQLVWPGNRQKPRRVEALANAIVQELGRMRPDATLEP